MRAVMMLSDLMAKWIGVPAAKAWMWLTGWSHEIGATLFMFAPTFILLADDLRDGNLLGIMINLPIALLCVACLHFGALPGADGPAREARSMSPFEAASRVLLLVNVGALALWPAAPGGRLELLASFVCSIVGISMWLANSPSVRSTAKDAVRRLAGARSRSRAVA